VDTHLDATRVPSASTFLHAFDNSVEPAPQTASEQFVILQLIEDTVVLLSHPHSLRQADASCRHRPSMPLDGFTRISVGTVAHFFGFSSWVHAAAD
jgi:hypothetical protein